MPDAARQLGIVEDVPYPGSPELTRLACEVPHPHPIRESMTIEQHHRAGFDQSSPRPSPGGVLRQTLEDRAVKASPDEQVGGQQARRTGTDDPSIDLRHPASL